MSIFHYFIFSYIIINIILIFFIPNEKQRWKDIIQDLYKKSFKELVDILRKWDRFERIIIIGIIPITVIMCSIFIVVAFLITPYRLYIALKDRKKQKHQELFNNELPNIYQMNKIQLKPPVILRINKEIPFVPTSKQIIYVESRFNERLNIELQKNYKEIREIFQRRNYSFIYIPKLIENFDINSTMYYFPSLKNTDISRNSVTAQNILDEILSFADEKTSLSGGLIRYKGEKTIGTFFRTLNLWI